MKGRKFLSVLGAVVAEHNGRLWHGVIRDSRVRADFSVRTYQQWRVIFGGRM